MKSTTFTFSDPSGNRLFAREWLPESGSPKAIIQVIHGLGEHSLRYEPFAEFFTGQGFGVLAYDHRGHGETDPDRLGYIPGEDGFHRMTKNILDFRNSTEQKYPNLPRILFAHSMGSFLTQRYMQLFDDRPAAIIYSGSSGKPPKSLAAGTALASLLSKLYGPGHKSEFIFWLTFYPYNSKFKPNRTKVDWISRDEEVVDQYFDDPFCGFVPTASFFKDFFKGLQSLHSHSPFADHDTDIPILLLSGADDPVSNMGEGVLELEQILRLDGVSDLSVKLYEGARHETINEINRDEVLNDLLTWINNALD